MKTIKVFPDYCSTGLWDESGAETSLEKLNINDPCANLSLKGINKVFEYIEPDDKDSEGISQWRNTINSLTKDIAGYLNARYGDRYTFVAIFIGE